VDEMFDKEVFTITVRKMDLHREGIVYGVETDYGYFSVKSVEDWMRVMKEVTHDFGHFAHAVAEEIEPVNEVGEQKLLNLDFGDVPWASDSGENYKSLGYREEA
jgi:hypothetical protein